MTSTAVQEASNGQGQGYPHSLFEPAVIGLNRPSDHHGGLRTDSSASLGSVTESIRAVNEGAVAVNEGAGAVNESGDDVHAEPQPVARLLAAGERIAHRMHSHLGLQHPQRHILVIHSAVHFPLDRTAPQHRNHPASSRSSMGAHRQISGVHRLSGVHQLSRAHRQRVVVRRQIQTCHNTASN